MLKKEKVWALLCPATGSGIIALPYILVHGQFGNHHHTALPEAPEIRKRQFISLSLDLPLVAMACDVPEWSDFLGGTINGVPFGGCPGHRVAICRASPDMSTMTEWHSARVCRTFISSLSARHVSNGPMPRRRLTQLWASFARRSFTGTRTWKGLEATSHGRCQASIRWPRSRELPHGLPTV